MNDFDSFTKIDLECRRFGQNSCCQMLWMVAQSAKNRPIWSHWRRVFFKSVHFLPPLPSYLQLVSTIVRDSKVPRFPPPSSKVFISWLETFLPREIFGARAHALGDGNSRDGSGRARARDETVGAHPKKKKNQFFVVEVDWKKLENLLLKVFAISIRSRWNCFRKKMWFSVSATDLHLTFIFSTWVGLESGKVQRLRSQWITLDRQIV